MKDLDFFIDCFDIFGSSVGLELLLARFAILLEQLVGLPSF